MMLSPALPRLRSSRLSCAFLNFPPCLRSGRSSVFINRIAILMPEECDGDEVSEY